MILKDIIIEKPKDKFIEITGRINANGVIIPFQNKFRW